MVDKNKMSTEDKDSNKTVKNLTSTSKESEKEIRKAKFQLNKETMLNKKIKSCNRSQPLTTTMEKGNNLRILCSTMAFEKTRNLINNTMTHSGFTIETVQQEDLEGQVFADTIKVKEKDSRRNKAIFTINIYRTTSSMMVNGPQVQKFIQEMVPVIQSWAQENQEELNMADKQLEKILKRLKIGNQAEIKSSKDNENIRTEEEVEKQTSDTENQHFDFKIHNQDQKVRIKETNVQLQSIEWKEGISSNMEITEQNKEEKNTELSERRRQTENNQERKEIGAELIMIYNDVKKEVIIQKVETDKGKE